MLSPFAEWGDPNSLGLCMKVSVVGVEMWVTCSGLGAGFRCADRWSPGRGALMLFIFGEFATSLWPSDMVFDPDGLFV